MVSTTQGTFHFPPHFSPRAEDAPRPPRRVIYHTTAANHSPSRYRWKKSTIAAVR